MKANRTRRGFSPCCVAAAALLLMGSDIMRGLVQEEQRLWICAGHPTITTAIWKAG